MKKLLAILLACFMLLSVFGGCKSSPSGNGSVSDKSKTGETGTKSGKKQIYLFIKNRGDLSYWDSMAEGGDRAAKDFNDKADIHVIETT
ncbi:MAG: BMP family ABC transporter substrate-binding protein, partial [Bacillota bacterium]|nr:BMP family ABC transporter substrate-binding protein [Bacillota bacterium]